MPVGVYVRTEEHNRKNGEGHKGLKRSDETKKKMSEVHMGNKYCLGRNLSESHKRKLSQANKEQVPWIKGKHHTKEARKRISSKCKGCEISKETRRKISIKHKGKKISEETRRKISKRLKGRVIPLEVRRKMSETHIGRRGKCVFWKDGRTPLFQLIRNLFNSKEWRSRVFKRDDYTCQMCFARSAKGKAVYLEAHHINPFTTILTEFLKEYDQFSPYEDKETLARLATKYQPFWDINNGQTLCVDCHNKTKKGGEANVFC